MKSLNKLKHYISQNKIIVLTIHPDIQSYIMQGDMDFNIFKWVTKILQYNLEIYPNKIINGRALYKQLEEDQSSECIMILLDKREDKDSSKILEKPNDRIAQLSTYFVSSRLPPELNASQRRTFKLNALNYCMIEDVLYRKNHDIMLLRCIHLEIFEEVLKEFHSGFSKVTTQDIPLLLKFYRKLFIGLPFT